MVKVAKLPELLRRRRLDLGNVLVDEAAMLREHALPHPAAFIEPCLPRLAKQPPAGRGWD